MTDLTLLLEVLKFFLMVYSFYKAYKQRQKEKAFDAFRQDTIERLTKLENVNKSKQLDE